jgi:hypothetical protein
MAGIKGHPVATLVTDIAAIAITVSRDSEGSGKKERKERKQLHIEKNFLVERDSLG